MKDLSPLQWGLLISTLLLLVIAFTLGFILFARHGGSLEILRDRVPFSGPNLPDLEYVVPIDRGTPLSVPERNQLRGEVLSIDTRTLNVNVKDEQWSIELNNQVFLRCLPKTMTGADGEKVPTKDILLDFSKATEKGTLVPVEHLVSQFAVGDDVTVQVNGDNQGENQIDFVVGYGCET